MVQAYTRIGHGVAFGSDVYGLCGSQAIYFRISSAHFRKKQKFFLIFVVRCGKVLLPPIGWVAHQ